MWGPRWFRGRGLAAWGFALALIALSGYGISLARELNSDLKETTATELAETLVQLFESSTEELSRDWLEQISGANDVEDLYKTELKIREESQLFDALYVWSKDNPSGMFDYPRLQQSDDELNPAIQDCLLDSATDSILGLGYGTAVSLAGCVNTYSSLKLSTSVFSARQYIEQGRAQEALDILDEVVSNSSENDANLGFVYDGTGTMELLIQAEILQATSYIQLDQPRLALDILLNLANEIENQNGAALLTLGPILQGEIVPLIASVGDMNSIRGATEVSSAVQRRLLGYKELTRRMDQDAPASTAPLATAYSMGGQLPFLIAYSEIDGSLYSFTDEESELDQAGGLNVKDEFQPINAAVQIDLSELLDWFIVLSSTVDQTAHEYLAIIDNYDNVLAGPDGEVDFIGEAQFRSLLPNLTLKINSQHQTDNAELYKRQFIMQTLPIFVAALLGIMALVVRNKADQQDKRLRLRQTEFATRVTHELKTPLAGIRLMAENLEMGAVDDPELAKSFAVRIVEESDKLTSRVEEILLIARSTNIEPTTPVDLFDLVAELTDEWEPRFDDAGIELRVDINESAVILGDPPILRDAISNMLDNAMKYRSSDVTSFVYVSLNKTKREAVLTVSDNGIGVPETMHRVIFERFARVEGPKRGKAGGHGLGLSFTNETITSHQGSIECRSNEPKGTSFIVRLPLASRAVTDKLLEG